MEENKIIEQDPSAVEDKSSFDVQDMYRALILNWHWFIISLIVCLGSAYLYLRYTQPIYQSYAKMLIKDDDGNRSRGIQNMSNLGIVTNSAGIDNEMEILKSHTLAKQVVKDLKLYTSYKMKGRMRDHLYYKDQPITVDMDAAGLDKLNAPVSMTITRDGDKYVIKGTYFVPTGDESYEGPYDINKTVATLPATINTRAGSITLTANPISMLNNGETLNVTLQSPQKAAFGFMGALGVQQFNKTTTIAQLTMVDAIPQRSIDYLKQLSVVYNRQANEDKNEISRRTEQFINTRLEKISNELGKTEG
ncbi:MAG: capsid assembly protein, partial [Prevotella sp.]|nr:capsid assembly protein [Prevotella sp.]